jgi:hypothetical protein
MTEGRVRDLVAGTAKLGNQSTDQYGHEFTSGARRARKGTLALKGGASQTIDAIAAGLNQAVQEERTNQVVDWIDRVAAKDLPVNSAGQRLGAPPGWVEWDPIRRSLLAVDTPQGRLALGANKMIPRVVSQSLKEYAGDPMTNPIYRGLKMITDPWRALYLRLNPGFYERHFVGHVILAAVAGGVNPLTWYKAFQAMRAHTLPELQGLSIAKSELDEPGLVSWPDLKTAYRQGGRLEAMRYIGSKIDNATQVTDSFARTVAYISQKQKGYSDMEALQYAHDALVDYGNLSNSEKYIVRSLVPFYGFSKGILKIAYRMPIDHPLAASVLYHIGQWQQEQAVDDNGNPLPGRYQGVVDLPLLGKVDLQKFSPFKDLSALTTPDGLVSSLQFAVQDIVRAGLGVAAPGTKASVKVDQYGRVVPDVSLGSQLGASFTAGPQGQLFEGLNSTNPAQAVESFFGVPVVSQQTLNNAGSKNVVSQAEVANTTQAQQQQAAQNPVDTRQLQQNLQTQIANQNPLNLPQQQNQTPVTQQQVQQQVAQLMAAQKQKAATTRASKGRTRKASGGGPTRRSSSSRRRSVSIKGAASAHAHIRASGGGSHSHGVRAASTRTRSPKLKVSRQAFGKVANKVRSGGGGGAPVFNVKSGRRGVATGHKKVMK